ncbi:MAG: DUF58 domain-containing protein [Pirellula sp.]|jgi:uncharacterized protein (DUF58 family)
MSWKSGSNSLASPYLESLRLTGFEKMRFTPQRQVEGAYSGRHASRRKGGAGEFVDFREYTPGDDLRRVDWKAMGRMDRAYLKLYQDETDLNCTLLIDTSGSMMQGGKSPRNHAGSKLEWGQFFATALSHLIVVQRDAVGLLQSSAVSEKPAWDYLPPSCSLQQRGLIHNGIARMVPKGPTQIDGALKDLLLRVRRRGVLLLLSDFLVDDMAPILGSLRQFRMRGWETVAFHLIHPDELRLPAGNAFRFIGLEQEGFLQCHVNSLRREYENKFNQYCESVRTGVQSVGGNYHRIETSKSYLEVLRSFLVSRTM